MKREFLVIIAIVLAGILIWLALILRPVNDEGTATKPTLGPEGSEHSHMRLLVVVFDEPVNFSRKEYMLKNFLVHLEDSDGTIIHKHATGVTLPYFFETLGMELTPNCLISPDEESYCTDQENSLKIFVNRQIFNDQITEYELRAGDKILINYGADSRVDLELKLNSLAPLPSDLYR